MKTFTPDQFRAELRRRIAAEFGGVRPAARAWGVDPGNLSHVLSGKKPPFGKLLRAIGYEWALVRT